MIRLSELLGLRCFSPAIRGMAPEETRVKLVRHKDRHLDLEPLRSTRLSDRAGAECWLDIYQKYQAHRVFDNCDQIVVFMGGAAYPDSRFIGVYDVGARLPAAQCPLPPGCPHPEWEQRIRYAPDGTEAQYFYQLAKRGGLEDLEDRLVIDWGHAPLAFAQWFTDREVVELRRPCGGDRVEA